ncbi:MAG: peptidase dimerization protein, partial [Vicinamibacterales bacterium]
IAGGVAPNVIAPAAEAEVLFRTVGPGEHIRRRIAPIESLVEIDHILEEPTVRLKTVSGYDTATFAYTTDIGFLGNWGQPLLFGPGSVDVAHTSHEFVSLSDLSRAVAAFEDLARRLIAEASSRSE